MTRVVQRRAIFIYDGFIVDRTLTTQMMKTCFFLSKLGFLENQQKPSTRSFQRHNLLASGLPQLFQEIEVEIFYTPSSSVSKCRSQQEQGRDLSGVVVLPRAFLEAVRYERSCVVL